MIEFLMNKKTRLLILVTMCLSILCGCGANAPVIKGNIETNNRENSQDKVIPPNIIYFFLDIILVM